MKHVILTLSAFLLASTALAAQVEFRGPIEKLPASGLIGDWQVAGRLTRVTASTKIEQERGKVALGSCVAVEGTSNTDGSVQASKIEVLSTNGSCSNVPGTEFRGAVEKLPASGLIGEWQVAGRVTKVTASTKIDQERGPVVIGACVAVEGTSNTDGSVQASKIEVKSGGGGCSSAPDTEKQNVEFRGVVQLRPAGDPIGLWQVSGRKVDVRSSTRILPVGNAPATGSCVEVQGQVQTDGTVFASRIQGLGQGVCGQAPGQQDQTKLLGLVESLPASGLVGDWKVAGTTVRVAQTTRIDTEEGPVKVGACVQARGMLENSVFLAQWIETQEASDCARSGFEFSGVVETMPASGLIGLWKIGGRDVQTSSTTKFITEKGDPKIGACVEVEGTMPATGPIAATTIEVKSVSGTCIFRGGVTNGASFSSFAVSPGQIVSVFGANIGPATELPLSIGLDNKVSSRLANTRVLFDGVEAALLYASQGQINAVVPCAVTGKTSTAVQVESNGAWSNAMTLPVLPAAPALFTLSNSGSGRAAALNYDAATKTYALNAALSPAAPGSTILLFGTGFGATDKACVDGGINTASALGKVTLPVAVTIGGQNAKVDYAGDAPGLVRGVTQLNVVVPADAPSGSSVTVTVKVGDRMAQNGVTVAVK